VQVKKLQAYIAAYKTFLKRDRNLTEVYKYETIHHFQAQWDLDAPDFGEMYAQCWSNSKTNRLWKRESWFPQEMMMKLIATDQEFVRRMFRDLFDETKPSEMRISRFKFGCDEMLVDFKLQNQVSIDNNHYHDDNEMILLYLTCRFPEQYCFFEYSAFRQTLELLGVINLPTPYDTERFFKLTKAMHLFLQKDEELFELHQQRRSKANYFSEPSKLIVHDFYHQVPLLKIS